ncbi:hypothetical protein EES45_28635 [Streptomyces sp. ADI97-07]|nr:hypothetical protein EES45_28635 [Streptomyces sp. ADI97-07]
MRARYSANPGRPSMCRSSSAFPLPLVSRRLITTGDTSVAAATAGAVQTMRKSPHQTQKSPK